MQALQQRNTINFFWGREGERKGEIKIIYARSEDYLTRRNLLESHSCRREKSAESVHRKNRKKKIRICTNPDDRIRRGTKDSPAKNGGDPVYRRFRWKLKEHSPETEEKTILFFSRATNYNMNRRDEIHRTPFNHEAPMFYALCGRHATTRY